MNATAKKKVHRTVAVSTGGSIITAATIWGFLKYAWPVLAAVATTVPKVEENSVRIGTVEKDVIECQTSYKVMQAVNDEQHKAILNRIEDMQDRVKDMHNDVRALRR